MQYGRVEEQPPNMFRRPRPLTPRSRSIMFVKALLVVMLVASVAQGFAPSRLGSRMVVKTPLLLRSNNALLSRAIYISDCSRSPLPPLVPHSSLGAVAACR